MSALEQAEIAKLDEDRLAAMTGKDVGRLAELFDDALVFTHSSGGVDGKASLLDKIASGTIDYLDIRPTGRRTIMAGEAALVFCDMAIDLRLAGAARALALRTLTVWRRTGGSWRVLAFHSTPTPI